jgi:tRNA dimethylallyltransferase
MLASGLIEEVEELRQRGDLSPDCPAMRSVGYRQVWSWLDQDRSGPLQRLIETGVAATRQLAKRQLTWLRGMPTRLSVDCLAADRLAQVEAHVREACAPTAKIH